MPYPGDIRGVTCLHAVKLGHPVEHPVGGPDRLCGGRCLFYLHLKRQARGQAFFCLAELSRSWFRWCFYVLCFRWVRGRLFVMGFKSVILWRDDWSLCEHLRWPVYKGTQTSTKASTAHAAFVWRLSEAFWRVVFEHQNRALAQD